MILKQNTMKKIQDMTFEEKNKIMYETSKNPSDCYACIKHKNFDARIGDKFILNGFDGIYILTHKNGNCYDFENKENGDIQSYIYKERNNWCGFFDGGVNKNIKKIWE